MYGISRVGRWISATQPLYSCICSRVYMGAETPDPLFWAFSFLWLRSFLCAPSHMEVFINGGTPKCLVDIGQPYGNGWFRGTPIGTPPYSEQAWWDLPVIGIIFFRGASWWKPKPPTWKFLEVTSSIMDHSPTAIMPLCTLASRRKPPAPSVMDSGSLICWRMFGHIERFFSTYWALFSSVWGYLGPIWGYVGPIWGYVGPMWAYLRLMLGLCWAYLDPVLAYIGPDQEFWSLLKNMQKHRILEQKWAPPPQLKLISYNAIANGSRRHKKRLGTFGAGGFCDRPTCQPRSRCQPCAQWQRHILEFRNSTRPGDFLRSRKVWKFMLVM